MVHVSQRSPKANAVALGVVVLLYVLGGYFTIVFQPVGYVTPRNRRLRKLEGILKEAVLI